MECRESETQSSILLMQFQTSCLARNLVSAQFFPKWFTAIRTSVTTETWLRKSSFCLTLRNIWLMENKQITAFFMTSDTWILLQFEESTPGHHYYPSAASVSIPACQRHSAVLKRRTYSVKDHQVHLHKTCDTTQCFSYTGDISSVTSLKKKGINDMVPYFHREHNASLVWWLWSSKKGDFNVLGDENK